MLNTAHECLQITVGPLNNRHIGGRTLILYREIVPYFRGGKLATPLNYGYIMESGL